jgi:hypothetical protein
LGAQVRNKSGGLNGPYGSGILDIVLPVNPDGSKRSGLGIHAGRQEKCGPTDRSGRRGPECPTEGCIRTTEEALDQIRELIQQGDRPKRIWIK